jgi:Methylamine utilisation protein MauE
MQIDPAIAYVLRGAFFALFAASLLHKGSQFETFRLTVRAYVRGSVLDYPWVTLALAVGVLLGEAAVVLVCVAPVAPLVRASVVAAQLLLYAAAMGINVWRGNTQLDCGCHWGSLRQTVGYPLVWRNLFLAILASVLVLPASARGLQALDFLSVGAGILLCGLLYAAGSRVFTQSLATRETA